MRHTALRAIRTIAADVGAEIVNIDDEKAFLDYENVLITVSRIQPPATRWFIEIEGRDGRRSLGHQNSPSGAERYAVEHIDRLLHSQAKAIEALRAVCADKGAALTTLERDRVVVDFEGTEVLATKGALMWTVQGEDFSAVSPHAWGGIQFVIDKLQERAATSATEEQSAAETGLTDFLEIREAINEAFHSTDLDIPVDHTTTVDELREVCGIGPSVDDDVIRECLGYTVKDEAAPMLVLTLGTDRVEVQVEIAYDDSEAAFSAALQEAPLELGEIAGQPVTLKRVGNSCYGDGVLIAYRAPQRDYYADNVEDVELFGVEVGRFRMVTADEDILARLEDSLAGLDFERLIVKDGVCKVGFHYAPGAPAGWAVELTAASEAINAQFDHSDGREEHVAWEPTVLEAQALAFEDFVQNPERWSEHLWQVIESRRQAA